MENPVLKHWAIIGVGLAWTYMDRYGRAWTNAGGGCRRLRGLGFLYDGLATKMWLLAEREAFDFFIAAGNEDNRTRSDQSQHGRFRRGLKSQSIRASRGYGGKCALCSAGRDFYNIACVSGGV